MKTILITGGSAGIGLGLKRALTNKGHTVISWSRREGVDIRRVGACQRAAIALPLLDGVIHCAGVWSHARADVQDSYALGLALDVNCIGAQRVQEAVWKHEKLRRHGVVAVILSTDIKIQTSSEPTVKMLPNQLAYNVSKLALYGLFRSWIADSMASWRFLDFYPGLTATGIWDPELGPAAFTLEETVAPIAEEIDRCISTQSSIVTTRSRARVSPSQASR
jgi:NAD(P)-dependent dehydrogenase (short-subunit alcohol dehydrogenase family)